MINIKRKRRLIKIAFVICIISILFYSKYSKRLLIDEIEIISYSNCQSVTKTDIDKHYNFKTYTADIKNKEDIEKLTNYIANREIRRINVILEPFFDSQFNKAQMMPRYSFYGYMDRLQVWGNKYVYIFNGGNKHKYYKFIDEIDLDKLEEMLNLKEYK